MALSLEAPSRTRKEGREKVLLTWVFVAYVSLRADGGPQHKYLKCHLASPKALCQAVLHFLPLPVTG